MGASSVESFAASGVSFAVVAAHAPAHATAPPARSDGPSGFLRVEVGRLACAAASSSYSVARLGLRFVLRVSLALPRFGRRDGVREFDLAADRLAFAALASARLRNLRCALDAGDDDGAADRRRFCSRLLADRPTAFIVQLCAVDNVAHASASI